MKSGPHFNGAGEVLRRLPSLRRSQEGSRCFKPGDMWGDGGNDRACNLILHCEGVFEFTIIALDPTVSTTIGINKASSDPNAPTRLVDATLQDVAHAELPSNDPLFVRLAQTMVTEVVRNDREIRTSGKTCDDFFCYAIRERGKCLVSTEACEGKNRNRRLVRGDEGRRSQSTVSTSVFVHTRDEPNAFARERLDQSLLLAVIADCCAHAADSAAQG